MDEHIDPSIPAAWIGDADLDKIATINPTAAVEIKRLRNLMNCGQESRDDFLHMCKLLADVGYVRASEYLLRRNVDYYDGISLYQSLFGTEKQEEFEFAIDAFKTQFDLEVSLVARTGFLISRFHTLGSALRSDKFEILSTPCKIEFGYIELDRIEADIMTLVQENGQQVESLKMFFVDGVWEIAD
jgi:hypothetical protein